MIATEDRSIQFLDIVGMRSIQQIIPSGHVKIAKENGPFMSFIFDLPMKLVILHSKLLVYRRVHLQIFPGLVSREISDIVGCEPLKLTAEGISGSQSTTITTL